MTDVKTEEKKQTNMLNEEEAYISKRFGNKTPFTVPDGYFEQLTDRVMSRLPEYTADSQPVAATAEMQHKPALIKRLRPWLAAACIAAAAIGTTVYLNRGLSTPQPTDEVADALYSDTYIDEAADYAMVDNQDIYAYLLADI